MFLGIDIGNSTVSIGLFKNKKLIRAWRIQNESLIDIKTYLPKERISSVKIASVVPEKNELFSCIIQEIYNLSPYFVDSTLIKGTYRSLGADRIANLIAGQKLFGLPVCVIDFGTATTIDVLDKEYLGGIILPGVELGLRALHQHTSLLPLVSFSKMCGKELPLLSKSTQQCIESGVYWGELYKIKGIIDKIKALFNPNFVCTGGMSKIFAHSLALPYEPWLTLWGLYFVEP
jgi:type III pantothenate kinase